MSTAKQDPLIPFIVQKFKRGAIVTHFGYEEEIDAMQVVGIEASNSKSPSP
jgi:hypothetical protein